jgi:2-dehydro-3-deoxygluconokinase
MVGTLLEIRPASACRWDLMVLGEDSLAQAVARSGLQASVVTALPDNDTGRRQADELRDSGVGLAHIRWIPDGVASPPNAASTLNSASSPDSASLLKPGDVPWSILFAAVGVRWFHTGGAFATRSGTTALVAAEAMETARRCGTIVSYDLAGTDLIGAGLADPDLASAAEVNARLADLADVVLGSAAEVTTRLLQAIESGATDAGNSRAAG